tara:strand:- start:690 stop:962 length:273 start_codon:yes stop_codon:yes gene_type:complete
MPARQNLEEEKIMLLEELVGEEGLRAWFGRNKGKGWIDCKTGKPCGRSGGEKRRSYPACRPTKAQCNNKGAKGAMKKKKSSKRVSWKKKK